MFNSTQIVLKLARELDDAATEPPRIGRVRVKSDPCLPQRLPSTGFLERDAEQSIPHRMIKQLRHTLSLEVEDPETDASEVPPTPTTPTSPSTPKAASETKAKKSPGSRKQGSTWKAGSEPESWEIFRAIEKKDLMFLMEVRDRAFHLLLRKSGTATPLVHCMRIGKSHQDIAIILLGAFSRWINNLTDEDMRSPKTKVLLRALRTNLKVAIDFGLQSSQNDLIASFMQTLVMSEGDQWVLEQVQAIAFALREGTDGKPVKTAEHAVRRFATKELGKTNHILALEDYVANATADLVMCAAWHCALDAIPGEPIPTWYFARDDRVHKTLLANLDQHATSINRSAGRRLRWQFRVIRAVMEGNSRTYRQKVEILAEELDEGPGV